MNMFVQFVNGLDPVERIVLCQILRGDRQHLEFQAKRTPLMTENILFSLVRQYLIINKKDNSASISPIFESLDYDDKEVICQFNKSIPTEPLYFLLEDMSFDPTEKPEIQWNFGIVQQRLLMAMLTKAKWLPEVEEYCLPLEILRKICPNISDMRVACGSMSNLQFKININSIYVFSEIFLEGDGIHFLLNPIINLDDLKQQLSDFDYESMLKIKCNKTMQLYTTLMKQTAHKPKKDRFCIPLDELRNKLGFTEKKYNKLSDFRRRVLDPAISDIQQHLKTNISYTINKDDHNTISITFRNWQRH